MYRSQIIIQQLSKFIDDNHHAKYNFVDTTSVGSRVSDTF